MKLIQAGLGSFGMYWYRNLKRHHPGLQVVVVDTDPSAAKRMADASDRFYSDLVEAIEVEKPDFLLNLTPPRVHTAINNLAFDHKLPVLCEKPIAADYQEAAQVVTRALHEGILFMIAENYRRAASMRRVKELINQGVIGSIWSLHCDQTCLFFTDKPYFMQLENAYLVDVIVHHLDLARFLSDREGSWMFAKNYHPQGSYHPGNLGLELILGMEGGITFSLSGNLATKGAQTDFLGHWRIEGTAGTIFDRNGKIQVVKNGKTLLREDLTHTAAAGPLEDFLQALQTGVTPQTSGADYLKTQCLVHYAEVSSAQEQMVQIELPHLPAEHRPRHTDHGEV
jgi:predicted dehydrogenase